MRAQAQQVHHELWWTRRRISLLLAVSLVLTLSAIGLLFASFDGAPDPIPSPTSDPGPTYGAPIEGSSLETVRLPGNAPMPAGWPCRMDVAEDIVVCLVLPAEIRGTDLQYVESAPTSSSSVEPPDSSLGLAPLATALAALITALTGVFLAWRQQPSPHADTKGSRHVDAPKSKAH